MNETGNTVPTDNKVRTAPWKKGHRLRSRFFYEFRSEFVFAVVLTACVIVSYILTPLFLPVEVFDSVVGPMQSAGMASICLLGAWLMFRHHEGMRIRKLWGIVLSLWAALEIVLIIATLRYDVSITKAGTSSLEGNAIVVGNLFSWLLLIYPMEALRPNWLTFRRAILQLLPLLLFAGLDYIIPLDLRWLIALYPMIILGMLITYIRSYRKWCEENYSYMESIDAQWLIRYIFMLLLVGASYYYICVSSAPSRVFTQQWLLFFMLGYSTEQILFRRDPWVIMEENANPENETDEAVDDEQEAANRAKLEEWMEQEKPYLNPEFKLIDLRAILPMNRTYLSQLINRAYGCNFYQFVTNYRIEEAKRLMREHPDMKVHEVAQLSGFASASVFSRTFTRETGLNPREWGKENDNS